MNLKKLLLLCVCLICLSSCFHMSQKIHRLPLKTKKSEILKTLGQPFKIQRKEGKDYWIYKFAIDGRHYTQTVIISKGKLYKKGKLEPYSLKSFQEVID